MEPDKKVNAEAPVVKAEAPKEVSGEEQFNRDAKTFMAGLKLLQKEHNIVMRPVITPYGPDLNLSRPEEAKESLMKK